MTAQANFCREVANKFRAAVREHLIDWSNMTAVGTGTPTPGCETSQAMAIFYNIFTEEEKPAAYKVLLDKIHEQNDHLDTGVLGARELPDGGDPRLPGLVAAVAGQQQRDVVGGAQFRLARLAPAAAAAFADLARRQRPLAQLPRVAVDLRRGGRGRFA